MPEPIRSLNCPSCGAPLPTSDQRRIVCQYCRATLELPKESTPGTPTQVVVITSDFKPKIKTTPTPLWKTWLIGLILISGMGTCTALGILFLENGQGIPATRLTIWSLTHPILLPGEPHARLISLAAFSDSTHRLSYFDFNQDEPLLWKTEDLGQETYRMTLQTASGRIYLADETRLTAFQQSDGARLWQATLNDLLPLSCHHCLLADEGQVIALTQLNTLQAFDATTGQPIWSMGLAERPDSIYLLNKHLVFPDTVNEKVQIQIVDPQTGQIQHSLTPTCPNETFPNDTQTLSSSDDLFPDTDGRSVYILYGFWQPACLEKWDLQTSERIWQTLLPEDLARNQTHRLQTSQQLFLAPEYGHSIWAIDLSSGQATILLQNEGYNLLPLAAHQNTLIVQAERTIGSQRYELWAINTQTGAQRWQTIPAGSPIEINVSEIINSEDMHTAFLTPAGLTVLQAFADPQRIVFETFNLENGSSNGQMSYAGPETTIFRITVLGWQANQIYLEQDGLHIFDTNTGQPVINWP